MGWVSFAYFDQWFVTPTVFDIEFNFEFLDTTGMVRIAILIKIIIWKRGDFNSNFFNQILGNSVLKFNFLYTIVQRARGAGEGARK